MNVKRIRGAIEGIKANAHHLDILRDQYERDTTKVKGYLESNEDNLKQLYSELSKDNLEELKEINNSDYEFLLDFAKKQNLSKSFTKPKVIVKEESVEPSDTQKEETSEKEKDE